MKFYLKILNLFGDVDQVYFFKWIHVNSATIFLLWYAGLFTRTDLDHAGFMHLQSMHTWIPTIWA